LVLVVSASIGVAFVVSGVSVVSLFIVRKKSRQRLQRALGEKAPVHNGPIDVMNPDTYMVGLTKILAGNNTRFATQPNTPYTELLKVEF